MYIDVFGQVVRIPDGRGSGFQITLRLQPWLEAWVLDSSWPTSMAQNPKEMVKLHALDTCGGFLLLLHNLAFGEVSELNGSIWFVAISVSRQSVSWYRVLNVRIRCLAFILTSAKFLLLISMDDGTFGYIISSFGFKVETDVGINGCFAPFWLLGTR